MSALPRSRVPEQVVRPAGALCDETVSKKLAPHMEAPALDLQPSEYEVEPLSLMWYFDSIPAFRTRVPHSTCFLNLGPYPRQNLDLLYKKKVNACRVLLEKATRLYDCSEKFITVYIFHRNQR
jgi:hypothetical protein